MCRNAKYRHVEHCGDAEGDFLTGLSGDEEDEPEKWETIGKMSITVNAMGRDKWYKMII